MVLVIGGSVVYLVSGYYSSLTKAVPPEELKSELPKVARMWQKNPDEAGGAREIEFAIGILCIFKLCLNGLLRYRQETL